eukprot:TRINITY_DN7668_c0_g2_i3.p3 TRINITY_DN7668_c0_g2~~TRINITY_DN7668_c0_g2_i3.p3  ORF type:complete len:103 (+),score=8.77 TRINITY_DN7668_c0_g2_i3:411-719(+)
MEAPEPLIATSIEGLHEAITPDLIRIVSREKDLSKVFELELFSRGIEEIECVDKVCEHVPAVLPPSPSETDSHPHRAPIAHTLQHLPPSLSLSSVSSSVNST